MRIVLTGGTGFVGAAVLQQLIALGHHVLLPVRPGARPHDACRAGTLPQGPGTAQKIPVDPWDLSAATAVADGADALVHLVGIISEVGSQRFDRIHPELTGQWLAAARQARVGRWVQMSALGTRPDARSRYHQSKWASECRVRESGLAWTVFRPSIIYGRHDAFTRFFADMSRWSPALPMIGGGTGRLQPIAVGCVAQAFAGALTCPDSLGKTWDLCGPERLSMAAILRLILEVTGRSRLLVPIPWPLARVQARILEAFYSGLLGKPSPLTRDQLLMLEEDNVGDGGAADRAFGLVHPRFREEISSYLGAGATP